MGAERYRRERRAGESAEEALRRLLAEQHRIVVDNEPRAAKGSVKGLHEVRVAMRRMRTLARTFGPVAPKFLAKLDKRASKVCDRMGKARDLDVWIELFHDLEMAGGASGMPLRERRKVLAELRETRTRLATEALVCGTFRRVKESVADFVDHPPARRKRWPPVRAFAALRMREVRETIAERHRKVGRYSSESAHNLRRAGRRMRYLSEFFAAQVGRECVRAGYWITKAQAALGKMHDCDNALRLSRDLPPGAARASVRAGLRKRRKHFLGQFKTAWRHYADKRLQKAWLRRLALAAAED
jgi:triphosphatase